MADDQSVDINYLKSADYREVACDGVLGGPTPKGKLWLGFYTERYPLPRITRHVVVKEADGFSLDHPGELVEGRNGLVRNVEFGVYFSVEEAQQLADWLTEKLADMRGGKDE